MTLTWGIPLTGFRSKKPDSYELVVGDKLIGEATANFPAYTSEGFVIELLKVKYHYFEPHFEMRYAAVKFKPIYGPTMRVRYYEGYIEVHLVVIKNPITWKLAIEAILGALNLIIIAYILTVLSLTLWYVGEKAGAVGIIGLIILGVVGLLVFAGVRFKR